MYEGRSVCATKFKGQVLLELFFKVHLLGADNLSFSCVIFYLYYNGIKTFHILQTARRIKVVK